MSHDPRTTDLLRQALACSDDGSINRFVAGTVFFSGSLYAMTFTGVRALGAITPIGGVCFIAGWVCLALAAAKIR